MPLVAPAAKWESLSKRLRGAVPEAFDSASRGLNLMDSEWKNPGFGRHYTYAIESRCSTSTPPSPRSSSPVLKPTPGRASISTSAGAASPTASPA